MHFFLILWEYWVLVEAYHVYEPRFISLCELLAPELHPLKTLLLLPS